MNPDKSINIAWSAKLKENWEETVSSSGVDNIPEDGWWSKGGSVKHITNFWGGKMQYTIGLENTPDTQ